MHPKDTQPEGCSCPGNLHTAWTGAALGWVPPGSKAKEYQLCMSGACLPCLFYSQGWWCPPCLPEAVARPRE